MIYHGTVLFRTCFAPKNQLYSGCAQGAEVEEIFENLAVGRQRSAIRQGKAAQLCGNMMTVAEVYAKLG